MKTYFSQIGLLALSIFLGSLVGSTSSAITILDPSYSTSVFHAHSDSTASVVSFDWDASDNIIYQTSTSSFTFGGLYHFNGITQTLLVAGSSAFAGASVRRVDDFVYYNTSDFFDQNILKYGPLSGSPSNTLISTSPNWGLHTRGSGELFITGAPGFGTNQIYYVSLDVNGDFVSSPLSLGVTAGASGPIAFDASGNLYYVPGFSDKKIYKWSAAEVAAAIADPSTDPLPSAASRIWHDYGADFLTFSGGTGLTFDQDGNLVLSLTNFSDPSELVRFDVNGSGDYAGYSSILSTTGRLSDVRSYNGSLYVAVDNTIVQVIPEPSTVLLLLLGLVGGGMSLQRSRYNQRA
jgi:hypothetical protein